MSNNVDITLAANSTEAQRAIDKMNDRLQKTEIRLEKMKKVSKEASYEGAQGFNKTVESIDRTAKAALIAVANFEAWRAAARAVGDEIRRNIALQEKARLSTLEPAQAIRDAKIALENDATLNKAGLEDAVIRIAANTRAKVATVASTIGVASSAKGDLTNANMLDAVQRALQIDPSKPEQAATLASRALDLAKFSGTTDARVNMGFIQNIGAASHVKNFEMIGQNLIPAINSLTKLGDSQEQAGELVSTMTQLMGEEEGRISATASLQLGQQMKDFFLSPEKKGKMKGQLVGKDSEGEFAVPADQFAALRAATSTAARMEVMRQSPELRRAFIGQASFETKAKESVLSLLRGDQTAMSALGQAQKVIRGTQAAEDQAFQARFFEQEVQGYEQGKFQQLLTAQQKRESATELAQLKNVNRQRIAEVRKTLEETLAGVNMPGLDDTPLIGQKQPLMAAFNTAMLLSEENLAKGIEQTAPEEMAARLLEKVPRKGGKLSGDMSPLDQQFIDSQIQALRQSAGSQGDMRPEGKDPQMEENNRLLREMVSEMKAGRPIGKFMPHAPAASMISRNREAVMNQ